MRELISTGPYSRVVEKFLVFPKGIRGEWHWLKRVKINQALGTRPMGGAEECYIRHVWIDAEFCSEDTYGMLKKEVEHNRNKEVVELSN